MDLDESSNQDENAISICAFVADVMSQMEDVSSFSSWMQADEVSKTMMKMLEMFPLSPLKLSPRSLKLLDTSATALWNAFSRCLQRGTLEAESLLAQIPLLVCRMLESCSENGTWKLFQVLIKCAEIYLGANMIKEASDVIHRATLNINSVDFSQLVDPEAQHFMAKYYILCAWMALKNDDLENAHMSLSQFSQDTIKTSATHGEQYAVICLSAFRLSCSRGDDGLAESLLQKLSQMFHILIQHHHNVVDCRTLGSGLYYSLATMNLKVMSETFNTLATEILQAIEQGDFLDPILRLEMISKQVKPNNEVFYQSLVQYIETVESTKRNFARSLQYIFKLRMQAPDKAMMALRLCYKEIHVFSHERDWLQQNFVALIRLVPSPLWKHSESLKFLNDFATFLNKNLPGLLSPAASNAALIILWKYIESSYSRCDYLEAQEWCRFSRHDIFRYASASNKANILRKLVDCSFQIGDFSKIKQSWELLPKQERDPTTIEIMYQTSLRDSDTDLATSLLASIIELENGEHRYVLAAIAAAVPISPQLRRDALWSLYTLVEKYAIVLKKKPINLDLHRALIRLLVYELHENIQDTEAHRTQICEVITWVVQATRQDCSDSNDHDWFVRCTYMLLLEASRSWTPSHLILLLKLFQELIDTYPQDVGSEVKSEIHRRQLWCNLLGMLIYTNLARAEEDASKKVASRYRDIQVVMTSRGADELMNGISIQDSLFSDFTEQYHNIICFNVEALIYLERWTDLESFIRTASVTANNDSRSVMADMILTSQSMPSDQILRNLQQLFTFTDRTNIILPSFMRCIFHLCMTHHKDQPQICETVLDQACTIAKDVSSISINDATDADADGAANGGYPDEELEYLSTRSFNYAVDLYLTGWNQDEARRWARKAIELASLMRDDCGILSQVLRAKYDKWLTYA